MRIRARAWCWPAAGAVDLTEGGGGGGGGGGGDCAALVDFDCSDDLDVLKWQLLSTLPASHPLSSATADTIHLVNKYGRVVSASLDLEGLGDDGDLWIASFDDKGPLRICSLSINTSPTIQPKMIVRGVLGLSLCEHCAALLDGDGASQLDPSPHLHEFVCQRDVVVEMGLGGDALLLQEIAHRSHSATLQTAEWAPHAPIASFLADRLLRRALQQQAHLAASAFSAKIEEKAQQFQRRIISAVKVVQVYEDAAQQSVALSHIDFAKLLDYTLEEEQKQDLEPTGVHPRRSFAELVLVALMRWFKQDLFRWCNQPPCPSALSDDQRAQHQMKFIGTDRPTIDEEVGWASRVEIYRCESCGGIARFPRFNNPAHMLRLSRRGRCGEFANVFGLLCRSLGFDVRYVLDFTDHVWLEVCLPVTADGGKGRSVHLDPCERALDTPMMYEAGWGKKLTHVIAASRYGVWDAIARYSRALPAVLLRRDQACLHESSAQELIAKADARLWDSFSSSSRPSALNSDWSRAEWADRLGRGAEGFTGLIGADFEHGEVEKRRMRMSSELQEMASSRRWAVPPLHAGELVGRSSGDLAWRQQRGECGDRRCEGEPASASDWTQSDQLARVMPWTVLDGVLVTGAGAERLHIAFSLCPNAVNPAVFPADLPPGKFVAINECPWPLKPSGVNLMLVDEIGGLWTAHGDGNLQMLGAQQQSDTALTGLAGAFRRSSGLILIEYESPLEVTGGLPMELVVLLEGMGVEVLDRLLAARRIIVLGAYSAGQLQRCFAQFAPEDYGLGECAPTFVSFDLAPVVVESPTKWEWSEVPQFGCALSCEAALVPAGASNEEVVLRARKRCEREALAGFTIAGGSVHWFAAGGPPLRAMEGGCTHLRRSPATSFRNDAWVSALHTQVYYFLGGDHHSDTVSFDTTRSLRAPQRQAIEWTAVTVFGGDSLANGVQLQREGSGEFQQAFAAPRDCPVAATLRLQAEEQVVGMALRCGALVDRIELMSNTGRNVSVGGTGGQRKEVRWPIEWRLAGLFGGLGGHLHNLGVVLCPPNLQLRPDLSTPPPAVAQDDDVAAALDALSGLEVCGMLNAPALVPRGVDGCRHSSLPALADILARLLRDNERQVALTGLAAVVELFEGIAEDPTARARQRMALDSAVLTELVLPCRHGLRLLSFGPAGFVLSGDLRCLISRVSTPCLVEGVDLAAVASWLSAFVQSLKMVLALLASTS